MLAPDKGAVWSIITKNQELGSSALHRKPHTASATGTVAVPVAVGCGRGTATALAMSMTNVETKTLNFTY